MARVMAVAFVPHGRLYYLDPGNLTVRRGDKVLYPTDAGPEVATVVWAPEEVDSDALTGLPLCAGLAGEADLVRDERNRRRTAEATAVAKNLIARHDLPMKVMGVDFIDRSTEYDQLVAIYYTAPMRVDFRGLLADLARSLRSRIDLRQVGARDAASLVGGIGSCGRELCCTTFLPAFEAVSMRMARLQDLPANPLQIAGQCGRLMCCIAYENEWYADFHAIAPEVGSTVTTPDGVGEVVSRSAVSGTVVVRGADGEQRGCPVAEVCTLRKARERV